jgi:hypothetical protein
VRFVRATKENSVFYLGEREKQLLFQLLKLYPRVPSAHHRLSRGDNSKSNAESQRLIEEALADQCRANKKVVEGLLKDPGRFVQSGSGYHLSLSAGEREWLLEILNDIRVGSWINLGSPEVITEFAEPNARQDLNFWAMELAGFFQMALLRPLEDTSLEG